MKNLKGNRVHYLRKSVIIPMIFYVLLTGLLYFGVHQLQGMGEEQELKLTEQAVKKAIVQCYAIEGRYPFDLSYLEENYSLTIDQSKFYIYYDCFSSNIMPDYAVYKRN